MQILPVGFRLMIPHFVQHTGLTRASSLMVSSTTSLSISKLFEEDVSANLCGIFKSCWTMFNKWDEIFSIFFGFCKKSTDHYSLYTLCYILHVRSSHQKLSMWRVFPSSANSELYMHVLILLKLIKYCNKTTVAFLTVFLERQSFLFHS